MVTSNEKYEQDIFESYREDEAAPYMQVDMNSHDEKRGFAYRTAYSDIRSRVLSYKDIAEIAIDTLSELELYELTAILNKHQKEKYEASI